MTGLDGSILWRQSGAGNGLAGGATVKRIMLWFGAALIAVVLTVLAFLPAAWMAPLIEQQTGGRFTLGDAQGSIWRGSGFVGAAPGGSDPVTPLLPGRFSWHLSPAVLAGVVDATLENPQALTQPVQITGSWSHWQISPAALLLPAQRLTALGAPLNTIVPSGQMRLSWSVLQLARQAQVVDLTGVTTLDLSDIGSRLSPIRPLGAYRLTLDWRGQQAQLQLTSLHGPLLLSGSGSIDSGRLQFSGRAQAEPGAEERLANLLNLLGQPRQEGSTRYIALEFH
jgi:general secretion pathway protein N